MVVLSETHPRLRTSLGMNGVVPLRSQVSAGWEGSTQGTMAAGEGASQQTVYKGQWARAHPHPVPYCTDAGLCAGSTYRQPISADENESFLPSIFLFFLCWHDISIDHFLK